MSNKPTCPYCGSPMYKCVIPHSDGKWGGKYDCSNVHCSVSSPYVEADNQMDCWSLAYKAAMSRPLQKPISKESLFGSIFVEPCWIEAAKNSCHDFKWGRFYPDVLDRDSVGCYGKLDTSIRRKRNEPMHYYKKEEYGKTWRCWRSYPTEEEQKAAAWEE